MELLAIFCELEAKTASCGQGMTQSKSELNTANNGQYLSTFYWGLIRGVGSEESCLLFSKAHLPPSWITSERPHWKLVSRFRLGQQFPVHRRFYSSLYWSTIDHLNLRWFSRLFYTLNADPKQGNAYNNSCEKVSVNCSRMIFDLKVYDSCRLPTFNSADKHRQTVFLYCLSTHFKWRW